MNQSEINTALDSAYNQLPAIGNVVDKESKILIQNALESLFLAIKASEAVTPEVAPSLDPRVGSDIQEALALRKVKVINYNLEEVLKEELPSEVKEMVYACSMFLEIFIAEKERLAREAAKKEADDAEFRRLAEEAAAEQTRLVNEKIEQEKKEADEKLRLENESKISNDIVITVDETTDPVVVAGANEELVVHDPTNTGVPLPNTEPIQ